MQVKEVMTADDLHELLRNSRTPCVSLLLSTTRGVRLQDNKHWKNLVREAEELLRAEGMRPSEVKELLRPAHELLDDVPFWADARSGLAAFLSPEMARIYRLPIALPNEAVVADHFQIKPLLPLVGEGDRFYVLALSQKSVRLFRGSRDSLDEMSLEGVAPTSKDEAVQSDWEPEMRNFHSHPARAGQAGARETIFHGQGAGNTSAEEGRLLEFAQRVNDGVRRLLMHEQAPLVLAGVDYLLAIYRKANTYPHLLDEQIAASPAQLDARAHVRELHDRAWPVVETHFRKTQKSISALYQQLAGTGRTANDMSQIAAASCQGQIQYLFVPLDQQCWGRFDERQQKAEVHEQAKRGDEDLLNFAAVQTLSHKGTAYAVRAEELPARPVAAIFRLPIGERSSKRVVV